MPKFNPGDKVICINNGYIRHSTPHLSLNVVYEVSGYIGDRVRLMYEDGYYFEERFILANPKLILIRKIKENAQKSKMASGI